MAAVKIMIPFYKDGAFHWASVTGTYDTSAKVDEGLPCVKATAVDATPAKRLQPTPTA